MSVSLPYDGSIARIQEFASRGGFNLPAIDYDDDGCLSFCYACLSCCEE